MVIRVARFNTFLLLLALLTAGAGCQIVGGGKQLSTVRVHIEVNPDGTGLNELVTVHSVVMNVEKSPFLTETDVASAEVVETLGGFALRIQFNQHGTWALEQYSSAAPGRRVAIFSQFGKKGEQARWLAAPRIGRRIADGVLLFTPDAAREEAGQIASGLNEFARKTQKVTR